MKLRTMQFSLLGPQKQKHSKTFSSQLLRQVDQHLVLDLCMSLWLKIPCWILEILLSNPLPQRHVNSQHHKMKILPMNWNGDDWNGDDWPKMQERRLEGRE